MVDWSQVLVLAGAILLRETLVTIRNVWASRQDGRDARLRETIRAVAGDY